MKVKGLGVVLCVVLAAACGGGDDDGGDGPDDADAGAGADPDAAGGGDGSLVVTNNSAITIAELYIDDSDDLLAASGFLETGGDSVTLEGIVCGPHEVLIIDPEEVGCLLAAVELCDTWTITSATYDDCE